ncbi:MAG: FAD-dependent oxidoreductase, partial [Conexivisphaera sp.]
MRFDVVVVGAGPAGAAAALEAAKAGLKVLMIERGRGAG